MLHEFRDPQVLEQKFQMARTLDDETQFSNNTPNFLNEHGGVQSFKVGDEQQIRGKNKQPF